MVKNEHTDPEFPTTSQKVNFLRNPEAYDHFTNVVEVRETHMSILFLTDLYVYKLKKPIKFDSVDFTNLDARHWNCREELRINQVMAPEVYLCITPLSLSAEGTLNLMAEGQIVDWLVKMQRLPHNLLLDQAIISRKIDYKRLAQVAKMLARFYPIEDPVSFSVQAFQERLRTRIDTTHQQLMDPYFHLDLDRLRMLRELQVNFLLSNASLFEKRILSGRIVEGHGDLKPEHISLGFHPAVIDRLELDKDLRIQDLAEDLSLLFVECELLGAPHVGKFVIDVVEQILREAIPEPLQFFYRSKQATLRAKFTIWHLREIRYRKNPKWRNRTEQCLALAKTYADHLK